MRPIFQHITTRLLCAVIKKKESYLPDLFYIFISLGPFLIRHFSPENWKLSAKRRANAIYAYRRLYASVIAFTQTEIECNLGTTPPQQGKKGGMQLIAIDLRSKAIQILSFE
jgi:hypothetical protein